jgi:tRNA A-37 threonylcarbamoyl transferase component Bud32
MSTRLRGSSPDDFPEGILFYTAVDIEAPDEFEAVWNVIARRHCDRGVPLPEERYAIDDALAIIVFADPADTEQMRKVAGLVGFMSAHFPETSPLMILAPHSVCPELRKQVVDDDVVFSSLRNAIGLGIDCVIVGEPEGMKLALEVHNKAFTQAAHLAKIEIKLWERQERRARAKRLERAVHHTVWVYCRERLQTAIPEIDYSLPRGLPKFVGDFEVGSRLGTGSHGNVHKLNFKGSESRPSGSVIKAVTKEHLTQIRGLCMVTNELRVMRLLSTTWAHPNIIQLQEVFHSETHVFLQMEDGGLYNLYKYLKQMASRQMSASKVKAVMFQITSAVCHMHLNAKVVHNDLKPENIIVLNSTAEICIKIADFDQSRIDPKVPSVGAVGTFPFTAPEVALHEKVDPYAAEMWSMGMVFLEVACFVDILHNVLRLQSHSVIARRESMSKIYSFFSQTGAVCRLLQAHMVPELKRSGCTSMHNFLEGLLCVNVDERLQAGTISQQTRSLLNHDE